MSKKVLFALFAIFFSTVVFSQKNYYTQSKKAIKYYNQSIECFNQRDFEGVLQNLDNAIKKDSNFIDAYLLRAELFRINYDVYNQIADLEKAISIKADYFPYSYYNLATAQLSVGKYADAKANFINFLHQQGVDKKNVNKTHEYLKQCDFALSLVNNPVPFKPISLGDSINTQYDEYWPSLSIDGKHLYYSVLLPDSAHHTITGHIAHQEDFYVSKKNNNHWSKGVPMGSPINTSGNEGALKVSPDGKIFVYTACNRPDDFGRCDIYFGFKTENNTLKVFNAGAVINTKYSEKQPCLSPDGQRLYFSSNRPGGIGGMDIWYSELDENGHWKHPVNMGKPINTKYDEESPFIHSDNKTFYFSSDGHPGLGLKDIFYSRLNDTTGWSDPKNIGYPINTFKDEIGLFIDNTGKKAYFSSNINSNSRDIYYFILPQEARPAPVSYLSGTVKDAKTYQPVNAVIELIDLVSENLVMKITSDSVTGEYLLCLPSGTEYALNVRADGYLFKSVHFNATGNHPYNKPLVQNITLDKIDINKTIVLNNIFFELNSYELKAESKVELNKIKELIVNNPEWMYEIGGHTDSLGTEQYNKELSLKRAEAVYNYLINTGVNKENLSYKGYGESQPAKSTENNAENRRTELRIIGNINHKKY